MSLRLFTCEISQIMTTLLLKRRVDCGVFELSAVKNDKIKKSLVNEKD